MLYSVATTALLLAARANAHFTVQYPAAVDELKEEAEDTGPCGGYTPSLDDENLKTVDFHVGGDSIATKSTHPQTSWLYRITTGDINGKNWTKVYPIVQQSGPGAYCTDSITIPKEYIGQKAILGIVGSGIDGVLYQCAAVRFVEGNAETPSACVNGTVTASFAEDTTLDGLYSSSTVDDGSDTKGGSDAPPEPTETPNAAPSLQAFSSGGLGSALLATGTMMVAGFVCMF